MCVKRLDGIEVVAVFSTCQSVSWFLCVTHISLFILISYAVLLRGVSLAWAEIRSHHQVIDVKGNWLLPHRRLTGRYWGKHGLFG